MLKNIFSYLCWLQNRLVCQGIQLPEYTFPAISVTTSWTSGSHLNSLKQLFRWDEHFFLSDFWLLMGLVRAYPHPQTSLFLYCDIQQDNMLFVFLNHFTFMWAFFSPELKRLWLTLSLSELRVSDSSESDSMHTSCRSQSSNMVWSI